MADHDIDSQLDKGPESQLWGQLIILGLGLLFGWGIGGDRKERAALEWAVQTSQQCELSRSNGDHSSVSDCLKNAIKEIEYDRADDAREQDRDPRR